jgi:biopolymer transport protein ExbD
MRESSRRIRRMERNRNKGVGLNLTSLMDVFTILVFFLLANTSTSEVLTTPKQIKLPTSVVQTKPKETVVIMVGPKQVLIQGKAVISTHDVLASGQGAIPAIAEQLEQIQRNVIGINTKTVADSKQITLLADKTIPFKVLKRIMSTCTRSGYGRISLAVIQKSSKT